MDIQSAAITELMTYLTGKLPPEFDVIDEFPNGNSKLNYPSVSLTPSRTRIHLKYPKLVSFTDVPDTVATIKSLYIVADVDIPIQLDLWCMSNDQRKYYLEILQNTLIQDPARSADLNLNLVNHYNAHANYQLDDSINFQDTSDDALVSEYRAKIDILCTTELIATKEEYKLLHLQLHTKYYVTNPELIKEIKVTDIF